MLTGAKTTYDEFKNSKTSEEKRKSLIKNLMILSSTAIGAYTTGKLFSNNSENIFKTYLNNLSVPVGGIITGFVSGEIFEKHFESEKTIPQKINDQTNNLKEKVKEKIEVMLLEEKAKKEQPENKLMLDLIKKRKQQVINNLDPGTIGKVFGYAGIGLGNQFDTIFSTLSGYKVGKEKGFKNKCKKAAS